MIYESLESRTGYVIIPDYPRGIDTDNPDNLKYLTSEEQEILLSWCSRLGKSKTLNFKHNSYGLKCIFAKSPNGFSITNGTLKGAMLKLGFKYEEVENFGKDWYFNYSEEDLKLLRKEEIL